MQPLLYTRTPPRNYNAALQTYSSNAVVYACVRLIADAVGSIPYGVQHNAKPAPQHSVHALLQQPNAQDSGRLWRAALATHLQLMGNAYILLLRTQPNDLAAPVQEMHLLRPERVQVLTNRQNDVLYYEYSTDVGKVRYSAAQILHLRLFSPHSDIYGMAPLEAATASIALHTACGAYQQGLLNNSARPSGCLTYEQGGNAPPLTDSQFSRLRDELTMHYTGAVNAGRPLLLEGGLTWQAMSFSPADLEFTQARHNAARDIASAFGVPPMLLAIPGDNTYANYQEAMRAFMRYSVVPMAEMVAQALTQRLQECFAGINIFANTDQLPAYLPEREALWQRVSAADFLTPDEKRHLLGLGV